MKRVTIFLIALLPVMATAQKKKNAGTAVDSTPVTIALKAANWQFPDGKAEFLEYKSRPALKLASGAQAVLKDIDLANGTIEMDIELNDPVFNHIFFRYNSDQETECIYFRNGRAGKPKDGDALQYAPFIKGVNMWNMYFRYQTNVDFKLHEWTHVKIVLSGKQMRVYVNNNPSPTLAIPMLEGNVSHGTIAFRGNLAISNLVVTPHATEGLPSAAAPDITAHDPRYLREWEMSAPVAMSDDIDMEKGYVFTENTQWTPIMAERNGLINLTRQFGRENRRMVWLRTDIEAAGQVVKVMKLGFCDEVWVLLNGKLLFLDKNVYSDPIVKAPSGRCSIENSSFLVPLMKGKNTLHIGVASNFFGWGIMARLDDLVRTQ